MVYERLEHPLYRAVLQKAIDEKRIELPENMEFDYEPVYALRALTYKSSRMNCMRDEDFCSKAEKEAMNHSKYLGPERGRKDDKPTASPLLENRSDDSEKRYRIGQYGCSFFLNYETLKKKFNGLAGKRIACGYVCPAYGSVTRNDDHVDLFRYEGVTPDMEIRDQSEFDRDRKEGENGRDNSF